MCNRCNCGCNNGSNREGLRYDERRMNGCGCNNEYERDPFREVERIACQARRRRMREDRCAQEFIRCMRRADCEWD